MEDSDDKIPMIPQNERKPYRMTKTSKLFHENLTSGSGANMDQVYRETEPRQMSLKLTIVTILVLVSTIVFLVLFLMLPLFYNLNHPLSSAATGSHAEEVIDRGHSHSSEGAAVEHAGHDGMKESEEKVNADKMLSMESEKMNSEWIQRISEICQCFAKMVEDGKSQSELKMTPAAVETCLRSCFSSESSTEYQRSSTRGLPGPLLGTLQHTENINSGQAT